MKQRIANKVLFKACKKGPFNYKKSTITEAVRRTQGTIEHAWLSVMAVYVLTKHYGSITNFVNSLELAT